MLYFNYKKIFELRGITKPFKFLMDNGFSRAKAYNITSSYPSSLSLANLDRMCTVLSCTPNDVLTWVPSKDSQIPETHPLHKLKAAESVSIAALTKDIPISQMPEIINAIQEAKSKLKDV